MERTSVHLAVLVVAEDPATVDLASATFLSDKLTGAGHRVVAQEVVEQREGPIRDQLARWIAQGHIDVIIAAGAGEAATAALAPLVTRPIAGLTDQLRLLARDRGSADKPVAARASSKLVFLLPPEIAALGAAMTQLVLPQLDSTAERNLVGELPRLKPAGEAVPQAISAEKTASGAGLIPKLPAAPRDKRKTGAYVIARREAGLEDPTKPTVPADPTKPVELGPLAKQRPRTAPGANDAPTRPHIDLASMLPPVPPGADHAGGHDDDDEDAALLDGPTSTAVTVQPARARDRVGTARPAPGSNDVTRVAPAPSAAEPVKPLPSLRPLPSVKPGGQRLPAPTPVSGATTAAARSAEKPTPVEGSAKLAPRGRTTKPSPPSPIDVVRPADLEAAAAAEAEVAPAAIAAPAARPSDDAIEPVSSAELLAVNPDDLEEAVTPPPTPRPRTAPVPLIPARPATGPAAVVPARPPSSSTPPPRPATGPAPVVPARPRTGPAPVVPANGAAMPVLAPPELLDLREGTQKKRRPRTGTALVRPSARSSILMYLGLAAAAVAGFFVVVKLLPRITGNDDRVAQAPPVLDAAAAPAGSGSADAIGSAEAAGSAEDAGSGSGSAAEAGSDAPPIDVETSTPPAHHASGPRHPAPVHAAPAHAAADHATPAHAETGSAAHAAAAPPAEDPDGCDEVSCVMDRYARACCAKYKPADEAFHPKGEVPDALDKAMVRAGIENVKPKVVACGETIAAKGTVKLAVTVAPAGTVSAISVSEAPDPALGECVKTAVKRATFGKSANGASFTYPFVF